MTVKLKKTTTNKNLMESLNLNYRVAPFIDQYIDENPEYSWTFTMQPKLGDDAWHPSGSCTPSVYELWDSIKNPKPRKLTVAQKKTFSLGHYYHQWLQDIIVRIGFAQPDDLERRGATTWDDDPIWMGPEEYSDSAIWFPDPENAWGLFPCEEKFGAWKPHPYHWATGSADVAPCTLPDDSKILIDIKSMASQDIARDYPPDRYVRKWECQFSVYLHWFPECEYALCLGVGKDSPHKLVEYCFHPNPELVDAIYTKWKIVSWALDEDIDLSEDDDIDLEPLYKGPVA